MPSLLGPEKTNSTKGSEAFLSFVKTPISPVSSISMFKALKKGTHMPLSVFM